MSAEAPLDATPEAGKPDSPLSSFRRRFRYAALVSRAVRRHSGKTKTPQAPADAPVEPPCPEADGREEGKSENAERTTEEPKVTRYASLASQRWLRQARNTQSTSQTASVTTDAAPRALDDDDPYESLASQRWLRHGRIAQPPTTIASASATAAVSTDDNDPYASLASQRWLRSDRNTQPPTATATTATAAGASTEDGNPSESFSSQGRNAQPSSAFDTATASAETGNFYESLAPPQWLRQRRNAPPSSGPASASTASSTAAEKINSYESLLQQRARRIGINLEADQAVKRKEIRTVSKAHHVSVDPSSGKFRQTECEEETVIEHSVCGPTLGDPREVTSRNTLQNIDEQGIYRPRQSRKQLEDQLQSINQHVMKVRMKRKVHTVLGKVGSQIEREGDKPEEKRNPYYTKGEALKREDSSYSMPEEEFKDKNPYYRKGDIFIPPPAAKTSTSTEDPPTSPSEHLSSTSISSTQTEDFSALDHEEPTSCAMETVPSPVLDESDICSLSTSPRTCRSVEDISSAPLEEALESSYVYEKLRFFSLDTSQDYLSWCFLVNMQVLSTHDIINMLGIIAIISSLLLCVLFLVPV